MCCPLNFFALHLQAMRLDHDTRAAAVQEGLKSQITRLASATHASLQLAGDLCAAAAAFRTAAGLASSQQDEQHPDQQASQSAARHRSGLVFAGMPAASAAVQHEDAAASSSDDQAPDSSSSRPAGASRQQARSKQRQQQQLQLPQLADLTQQALGFSLRVSDSRIPHDEAGQGLFVQVSHACSLRPGLPPHRAVL
jgi:hypothetical protein